MKRPGMQAALAKGLCLVLLCILVPSLAEDTAKEYFAILPYGTYAEVVQPQSGPLPDAAERILQAAGAEGCWWLLLPESERDVDSCYGRGVRFMLHEEDILPQEGPVIYHPREFELIGEVLRGEVVDITEDTLAVRYDEAVERCVFLTPRTQASPLILPGDIVDVLYNAADGEAYMVAVSHG